MIQCQETSILDAGLEIINIKIKTICASVDEQSNMSSLYSQIVRRYLRQRRDTFPGNNYVTEDQGWTTYNILLRLNYDSWYYDTTYWSNEAINENHIGLNAFLAWIAVAVESAFVSGRGFFLFRPGRPLFLSITIGPGSLLSTSALDFWRGSLVFVLLECSLSLLGDFLGLSPFKAGLGALVRGFVLLAASTRQFKGFQNSDLSRSLLSPALSLTERWLVVSPFDNNCKCYHEIHHSFIDPFWYTFMKHTPKIHNRRWYLITCLLVWGILFKLSSKLELSVCLFGLSLSFFKGSTMIGPRPRNAAAFLVTALVRLPVKAAGVTLGVLTTNDEIDLSLTLTGSIIGDSASSALTFFLLNGKNFDLTSCILWSALKSIHQKVRMRGIKDTC
jgi:hypothetical protein